MSVKGTTVQKALTTAASLVLAANVNRSLAGGYAQIQNDATVDVLWGFSSTTCTNRLQPGQTSEKITVFSAIWAKTASSTGNLDVTEAAEI